MEKVYRTVALVPKPEMQEILADKGQIEVRCEFCKRDYVLKGKELEDAYDQAQASAAESKSDE